LAIAVPGTNYMQATGVVAGGTARGVTVTVRISW
jgi:hypothetical protein